MIYLLSLLFGLIEGISEWLPISSTGHLLLFNSLVDFAVSEEFYKVYEVVIQLAAVSALVVLFFPQLWPFGKSDEPLGKISWIKGDIFTMWLKIAVACLPAVVVGLTIDDLANELFYHPLPVALALIIFGVLMLGAEWLNKDKEPKITSVKQFSYTHAILIGLAQCLAAIFPGASRSACTVITALLLGSDRRSASKFSFFLSIPVMFGASLLKIVKAGVLFGGKELLILAVGMISAFLTSLQVIKYFMRFIRKHNFKPFAIYRIFLGILILIIL